MRIFDAHTHLQAGALPEEQDFYHLATASTVETCQALWDLAQEHKEIFPVAGIHPWHSLEITEEALLPYLSSGIAIGEIGMDSVWCSIDLAVQEQVFRQQLALASKLGKPVVLHTKGCEAQIAQIIADFPQPILVHWYSCEEHLQAYIDKGCYFTVGPDLLYHPAVAQVVARVPLDRLLLESDGVSAVSWGTGKDMSTQELSAFMSAQIAEIAQRRGVSPAEMEAILFQNTLRFLSLTENDLP